MELVFLPDSTIWDGRFANNGWVQELPKPLTRLTWDNAALISPATGEKLGVSNEDVVELQFGGQTMRAPIWIMPGQSDQTVAIALGYGRTHAGHVGNGAGFNAYNLRRSDALWFGRGLEIRKTGERHPLSCTQHHQTMEGRDLVRVGTINEFEKNPSFAHNEINQPSLYPPYKYDGYAWGMAIDQTACVGCSACVVACQSENNIPIVGKDQVARGREMHWIRIDRYFQGELDSPSIYFEPVPCMHCENAPCEVVCPVGATQHSNEGLNEMVYNRCIGTRYCSNNCPYKVRRFNFLQYSDVKTPSLKMLMNPNVTVRNRGVMEKCTYCVQRIQAVKITAETGDRKIRDGEIIPACGQVCPTQAIVFGDINDPTSQVATLKAQPHNYGLLVELNARPRTTYLARIRNPNPEIET
jgi:Fe-S-cluster-containing dehydrogenase component